MAPPALAEMAPPALAALVDYSGESMQCAERNAGAPCGVCVDLFSTYTYTSCITIALLGTQARVGCAASVPCCVSRHACAAASPYGPRAVTWLQQRHGSRGSNKT
jgi:hypothetical protein